jgi:hypothetical protein
MGHKAGSQDRALVVGRFLIRCIGGVYRYLPPRWGDKPCRVWLDISLASPRHSVWRREHGTHGATNYPDRTFTPNPTKSHQRNFQNYLEVSKCRSHNHVAQRRTSGSANSLVQRQLAEFTFPDILIKSNQSQRSRCLPKLVTDVSSLRWIFAILGRGVAHRDSVDDCIRRPLGCFELC